MSDSLRRKRRDSTGRGLRNSSAGRVVDGNAEKKGATISCVTFGALDLAKQRRGDPVAAANHFKPRALLAETFALKAKKGADDPEDTLHLLRGARPVVG